MSGRIDQNFPVAGGPIARLQPKTEPLTQGDHGPDAGPQVATDRLHTDHDPVEHARAHDPHSVYERVKAMKEQGADHLQDLKEKYVESHQKGIKRAEKSAGFLGDVASILGSLGNAVAGTPQTLLYNIQGLFSGGHTAVKGAHALKTAKQDEGILKFLGQQGRNLGSKVSEGWHILREEGVGSLYKFISNGGKTADEMAAAASKGGEGLVDFYRAARAGGSGVFGSLGKAFGRTVDAGGSMPAIAEQAANMGGRWGKALLWGGRFARVAPLINVPVAAFDLMNTWKVWHDPKADMRKKVSVTGTSVLSTTAAGLAVAGFLTPPPIDAALWGAAGIVGIGSMVWGALSSQTAVNIYKKIGHVAADVGKSVGHAVSSAAKSVGHAIGGAAKSVAHFFGL